jgi:putative membrane protein
MCFLGKSILFWWCILWPWPAERRRRNWGVLIYLISADVMNTMLSAFLAFCGRPVRPHNFGTLNPLHLSPIDDRVLGVVMTQ